MAQVLGRVLVTASLVAAAAGCDRGDDDGAQSDVVAWCEQFDDAIEASTRIDVGPGRDDPGFDEALGVVDDEMAQLDTLDPPPAIAADWALVTGPLPTNATGGIDVDGQWAEAGARIAAWARDECDLSSGTRAALEDAGGG